MFTTGSRYLTVGTYQVTLADGTQVTVARSPLPQTTSVLGWHRRAQGERLDLLGYQYLGDATMAWRLGWENGAVVLDALAAHELIAIPAPR
jgi:hypothetical protein